MKSNDEVMILIKIREQKEEIAKLKDKVECLQDKLDKARIELDYLIHRYYVEESYELTIEEIERIMDILKGDNK